MSATAAVQQNNNEEPGLNGKLFFYIDVLVAKLDFVYVLMLFCRLLAIGFKQYYATSIVSLLGWNSCSVLLGGLEATTWITSFKNNQ